MCGTFLMHLCDIHADPIAFFLVLQHPQSPSAVPCGPPIPYRRIRMHNFRSRRSRFATPPPSFTPCQTVSLRTVRHASGPTLNATLTPFLHSASFAACASSTPPLHSISKLLLSPLVRRAPPSPPAMARFPFTRVSDCAHRKTVTQAHPQTRRLARWQLLVGLRR